MFIIYFIDSIPYIFFISLPAYLITTAFLERRQRLSNKRKVGDYIYHQNDRNKSRNLLKMQITSILYVCSTPDYVKPFYISQDEADRNEKNQAGD